MKEEFKKEIQKIINEINERLKHIRSYKLSLSFLENIEISLYHSKYPLKSLCHISQLDPLTFKLEPFDLNILKDIEIAILERKIRVTINKEKNSLIIKFPPLTEEDRKDIIKSLQVLKEEMRIKSRKIRDDFLKKLKTQKEEGEISEDNFYKIKASIDEEIEKFNQEIEKIFGQKEKEILG